MNKDAGFVRKLVSILRQRQMIVALDHAPVAMALAVLVPG
jgi:hypothetical protein